MGLISNGYSKRFDTITTVYNFAIPDNENYFVGEEGMKTAMTKAKNFFKELEKTNPKLTKMLKN